MDFYIVATENYLNEIAIITTDKTYLSTNEYKDIINSIKIKDKKITTSNTKIDTEKSTTKSEDEILWEATKKGLLTSIPFFIIGCFAYVKRKNKKIPTIDNDSNNTNIANLEKTDLKEQNEQSNTIKKSNNTTIDIKESKSNENEPLLEETNIKEENQLDPNSNEESKPLAWYKFYNYFIIPIEILICIFAVMSAVNSGIATLTAIGIIVFIPIIFLNIILFFYMLTKDKSTLKMLKISIYIPVAIYIIFSTINILGEKTEQNFTNIFVYIIYILAITAWALLNVSYFEDRKEIFKN